MFRKKEYPFSANKSDSCNKWKEYFIAARDTLIEEDDLLEVIAIVTGIGFYTSSCRPLFHQPETFTENLAAIL